MMATQSGLYQDVVDDRYARQPTSSRGGGHYRRTRSPPTYERGGEPRGSAEAIVQDAMLAQHHQGAVPVTSGGSSPDRSGKYRTATGNAANTSATFQSASRGSPPKPLPPSPSTRTASGQPPSYSGPPSGSSSQDYDDRRGGASSGAYPSRRAARRARRASEQDTMNGMNSSAPADLDDPMVSGGLGHHSSHNLTAGSSSNHRDLSGVGRGAGAAGGGGGGSGGGGGGGGPPITSYDLAVSSGARNSSTTRLAVPRPLSPPGGIDRLGSPSVTKMVLEPIETKMREYQGLMDVSQREITDLDTRLRTLQEERRKAEEHYVKVKTKYDEYARQHANVDKALRGELLAPVMASSSAAHTGSTTFHDAQTTAGGPPAQTHQRQQTQTIERPAEHTPTWTVPRTSMDSFDSSRPTSKQSNFTNHKQRSKFRLSLFKKD